MLWEEMIKEEREEAYRLGFAVGYAEVLVKKYTSGLNQESVREQLKLLLLILGLTGELSEPVRERILHETDAERLREYFSLAQEAESMEVFEEEMNKLP